MRLYASVCHAISLFLLEILWYLDRNEAARTSVMLQKLPKTCTVDLLQELLDRNGFRGVCFTLFYHASTAFRP